MQEEVDQKTIALAVKTGKLTAQVLQAAIRKYLAARQKGTGKAHHGQQSLRVRQKGTLSRERRVMPYDQKKETTAM